MGTSVIVVAELDLYDKASGESDHWEFKLLTAFLLFARALVAAALDPLPLVPDGANVSVDCFALAAERAGAFFVVD